MARPAFTQIGQGMSFRIEPSRTFVVRGIRAVAGKTLVRKNRTDVTAEVNRAGSGAAGLSPEAGR